MTDEEFRLLMTAPEDNLGKQRKRSGGGQRGKSTAATMSDEEFRAAMGDLGEKPAPAAGPAFKLTNYSGGEENKAGPYTEKKQKLDADYKAYRDYGGDDPFVQDPIAQTILAGTLGAGVGAAVGPLVGSGALGTIGSGVAEGASGAVFGGAKNAQDIITAGLTNGAARGLTRALPGGMDPHVPRTSKEIDAATLKRAEQQGTFKDPGYRDLPEGPLGTDALATRAEEGIAGRLEGRKQYRGEALNEAENNVRQVYPNLTVATDPEIRQLEIMRQQRHGAAGPLNPAADERLAFAQRQLGHEPPLEGDTVGVPLEYAPETFSAGGTRATPNEPMSAMVPRGNPPPVPEARLGPGDFEPPLEPTQRIEAGAPSDEGTSFADFDQIRGLQKELNYRIKNRAPGDYGTAGDEQAAGIVAGAARRADPREGPGNFAGALDRYGAGEQADANINELLYNENGSIPPDRLSKAEAGRNRLAAIGATGRKATQPALNNEARMAELAQAEPEAADIMDRIRQRNTKERRGLFNKMRAPYSSSPIAVTKSIGQGLDNLDFHLRPPSINDEGMVYRDGVGAGTQALPLELQLLLMQNDRREGR